MQKEMRMALGTVKWFKSDRGFGYITPQDGSRDVFVDVAALTLGGLPGLTEGQAVEYEVERKPNDKIAATKVSLRS